MERTAAQLIADALEEIGVVGAEVPTEDSEYAKGLNTLQAMHDSLNADRLQLFYRQRASFSLSPTVASYTLGVGWDINVPWTNWVTDDVMVTPVGETFEIPVLRYRDRETFLAEPLKTMTDAFPRRFWYEPTWPAGLFTVWPVPTTVALISLDVARALTTPATLQTALTFPPGYYDAWKLNLAKRLCRPFSRPLTPDLIEDARAALALIRRNNDPGPPPSRSDPMGGTGYGYDITINRNR